jgi:hypothetical protein
MLALLSTTMFNDSSETKKRPSSSSSKAAGSNADANAVFLPAWFVPTEKDVICGWYVKTHRDSSGIVINIGCVRCNKECTMIDVITFNSFTICRARQNHRHKGNQRFRQLVEFSAPLYVAARTKLEKTNVIQNVVEKVRRDSVGGGFVKKDFNTGLWFEIGDDRGAFSDYVWLT